MAPRARLGGPHTILGSPCRRAATRRGRQDVLLIDFSRRLYRSGDGPPEVGCGLSLSACLSVAKRVASDGSGAHCSPSEQVSRRTRCGRAGRTAEKQEETCCRHLWRWHRHYIYIYSTGELQRKMTREPAREISRFIEFNCSCVCERTPERPEQVCARRVANAGWLAGWLANIMASLKLM